jgi:hypothetical protein
LRPIPSDGRVRQGHGPHIGVNDAARAACNVVNETGVGDGYSTSFDVNEGGKAEAIPEPTTRKSRLVAFEGGAVDNHRTIIVEEATAKVCTIFSHDAVDEGQRTTVEDSRCVTGGRILPPFLVGHP